MEPIDRRITAAQIMALRSEPHADRRIAELLGVARMSALDAVRTRMAIEEFLERGDATTAAQLIHTATVRQNTDPERTGL